MIKSYDQGIRNCFLVRPEHLNHEGHLFGGVLMAEIDTTAYCLLRQEYEDKSFVSRAAEVSFDRPARLGDVILLEGRIMNVGVTSVQVEVVGVVEGAPICSACMTYVNVGPDGKKAPL